MHSIRTVRANIKCPKVTVVTQYFCNINSRYYIAYYCVGDRMVRTKKTGQTKGRGVEACYEGVHCDLEGMECNSLAIFKCFCLTHGIFVFADKFH